MAKVKIGIIGGTGLNTPDLFKRRKELRITTPFGEPSNGSVLIGDILGVPCVLISRHGAGHHISPSKINFRANIWALKELGCTHVIATTATGSLREEIKPGDIVIVDDFIDRTHCRKQTFYDGEPDSLPGVFHLPMYPAFCEPLRNTIIQAADELKLVCHKSGTVVTIEGPRFSSRAESKMFRTLGCDLVNMTTVPEVILAKEAGLLYAAIALATDYDCWRDDHSVVTHEFVQETFKTHVDKLKKLLIKVVVKIAEKDWYSSTEDLKKLIINSTM